MCVPPPHGKQELRLEGGRRLSAMRAEIAKAEDALSIGDDDKFGRIRPVGQQFRDASAIIGANEHEDRRFGRTHPHRGLS